MDVQKRSRNLSASSKLKLTKRANVAGVETVKVDTAGNKLTVTGKVDPTRIKERVEYKTKKKAEILSPQPKKDVGAGEEKKESPPEIKSDDKKPKEPQSATVVLKIPLHCDGCINKIKRAISKVDGVESVTVDSRKDLVTVKGTFNVKELIPHLKENFKRKVDIVPSKEEDKDGDIKDDKIKDGDGGEDSKKDIESVNKFEYHGESPHTYMMQMYNPSYYNQDYGVLASSSHDYVYQGYNHEYAMEYSRPQAPSLPTSLPPMHLHEPRMYQPDTTGMFSDENPNACLVM
ncbi:hypothetical protein R6Q59_008664 [Mikania micrantha]